MLASNLSEPFEGQYSKQVCDPCHRRRAKCDRETPTCRQCIEKNTPCSYNRQLKLKRRDSDEQTWQAQMQVLPLGRQPNKPTRKRRSKQEMALARGEFPSITPNCSKRDSLEPSLTPTPPSNGPERVFTPNTNMNMENAHLLQVAVDGYMNQINPLFPLFFPSSLFSHQRSEFLLAALYLAGLGVLPTSAETELWQAHYSNTLMRYISNGILLVPTIDTLQALLINHFGLSHHLPQETMDTIPTLAESLHLDPPSNLGQKCEQHMAFTITKFLFPNPTNVFNTDSYLVPMGITDLTWQTLVASGMRLQDLGGMVLADHFLQLSQLKNLIPKDGTPFHYQKGWRRVLDTWRQCHQSAEAQLRRIPNFIIPMPQDYQWLDNFNAILTIHSLAALVSCIEFGISFPSHPSLPRNLIPIKLSHNYGFHTLSQISKPNFLQRTLAMLEFPSNSPKPSPTLGPSQRDLLIHLCRLGYDRLLTGPSP